VPRHTFDLNDTNWLFGQVPRQPFAKPDVYDLPAVSEWFPATIPGNVRTDLLALGRIPDPFFGEQYRESLWVEACDWWYRRTIEPPAPFSAGSRAFLVFEGIDYLSAIFVNGRELARHEGMFSRQTIEISAALRAGPVEVAVRVWGSSALPTRHLSWPQRLWQKFAGLFYRSWVGLYPDRTATLKCQMSFGWDFAPLIRTMGIWDEVSLVITGPVVIVEAKVTACLKPPPLEETGWGGIGTSPTTPADLLVSLTLAADQPGAVQARIQVSPTNFQGPACGPFSYALNLPQGCSQHQLACYLPQASLWQPWDRGQPHLYQVQLTLLDPGGEPLDQTLLRTGLRTVELQNWQFNINGQPEFMRGLNWVPADCFPGRLRRDDYARLLSMARESGANMLRVWGGGLREKQAFYDLCDELGLLVWQEFPFACEFLGSYPHHPAYLALVEAECSAIVRHLRHHPALILWCGGNEFSRSRSRPLLDTLAVVVQQHDGTRPFIPVSPGPGDSHNWHVWHGCQPIQAYQGETARFLSEFGLQALPQLDTLSAALPNPTSGWETHHADLAKLEHYAHMFHQIPAPHFERGAWCVVRGPHRNAPRTTHHVPQSPISHLQSLISSSQLAQATALQTAIEHMRRRKGQAGGVCLWQFNEPWPAISWAIVDYFGRPKLAYERLKWWYHPILISLKFPVGRRWQADEVFSAEIWAINDSLHSLTGCTLQVSFAGELVHTQALDLPADSAGRVGGLMVRLPRAPGQITLNLQAGDEILARNSYDLAWFDKAAGSLAQRLRRRLAEWALR
jgi:beta-mannosidase